MHETGVYKDGFRLFHYLFAYDSIPCFHNIFKSGNFPVLPIQTPHFLLALRIPKRLPKHSV